MKKSFIFLSSILLFLFAACNIFQPSKGSVNIHIDGNVFYNAIRAVNEEDIDLDNEIYTATLETTGRDTVIQEFNRTTGTTFVIDDIDEGSVLTFKLSLAFKGVELYSGTRESYVVLAGENKVEIKMEPTDGFNPYRHCNLGFESEFGTVAETKRIDRGYKLTEEDLKPLEYEGYKFDGWYIDDNLAAVGTEVTKTTTIHAKWTKIILPTFTVTYITENGKAPEVKTVNQDYKLTEEDLINIIDDDYMFVGWYFDDELVSAGYQVTSDIKLTAKWERKPYNSECSSIEKVSLASAEDATAVELRYSFKAEADKEYYVAVLNTKDEYLTSSYDLVTSRTDEYLYTKKVKIDRDFNDFTFVVRYKDNYTFLNTIVIKKFLLSYDSKGHGVAPENKVILTSKDDYALTAAELPASMETDGYKFLGWDNGLNPVREGSKITSDTVLTANWVENSIPTYTVSYITEHGSAPAAITVQEGYKLTKDDLLNLSDDDYSFEGWYLDDVLIGEGKEVSADIILIAKWKIVATYAIEYASDYAVVPEKKIVKENYKLTDEDLKPLKNEGYIFEGWFIGETSATAGIEIKENVKLTAKWTKIVVYTIKYVSDYGVVPNEKTVSAGYILTDDDLKPLETNDYTFLEWFSEEINVKSGIEVTSDITLTAKWIKIPTYTIKYSTEHGEALTEKTVKSDYVLTADDLKVIKDDNYLMVGWYADKTKITAGYKVASDINLTAKWERKPYDVKLPEFTKLSLASDKDAGTVDMTVTFSAEVGKEYYVDILNKKATEIQFYGKDDYLKFNKITSTTDKYTFTKTLNVDTNFSDFIFVTHYADAEGGTYSAMSFKVKKLSLSYSSEHGNKTENKVIFTTDKSYTITENDLPQLSETDYSFMGWYTNDKAVEKGYVLESSIELTAKWLDSSAKVFKVTFDKGLGVEATIKTVNEGYKLTAADLGSLTDASGDNEFLGWYIEKTPAEVGMEVTTDITVKAVWRVIPTYTITYVTEVGDAPKPKTVKEGKVLTAVELAEYYNEDYVFEGWFFGDEHIENGYVVKSDIVLTAKWTKIPTYKISYYTELGTAPSVKEVKTGYKLVTADLETLTDEDYTFDGWNVGEESVAVGYEVKSDIVLTAKWTKIPTYTVKYSTEHGEALTEKTVKTGYILTEEDIKVLTAEGYTFSGWFIGETSVTAGYEVKSDVELTAKWVEVIVPTYTVKFNLKDGLDPYEKTVKAGYKLTEYDLTASENEGYTFKGWYIGETPVEVGYEVTADVVLTARWEKIPVVIPTFTLTINKGLGAESVVKTVDKGYKLTAEDLETLTDASGDNEFLGWYIEETKAEVGMEVTTDITVKAVWRVIPTYTITYVTEVGDAPKPKTVKEGKVLTAVELAEYRDEDYVFEGWFIGEERIENGYVVKSNIVLTAKWTQIPVVNPTFTLTINKGLGAEAVVKTVDKGYKLTSEDLETLVDDEDRWTFDGWYVDGELITEGYEVTKETLVTAKWTQIPYYTVSYVNSLMTPSASKEFKTGYKLMAKDLPDCSVAGYTFGGWYSGDELVKIGDEVTSDLELVAKWEAIAPEITMILRKNGQECEKTGEKFMLSELDYLQLEIAYDTTIHQENSLVFQFKINDEVIESTKHSGLQLSELLSRDKLEAKDYKLTVSIKVDGLESTENVAELSFTFVEDGTVTPVIGMAIPNYYIKKEFDGEKIYTFTVTVSDVDGTFADNSTFIWKLNGKVVSSAENSLKCVVDISTDENLKPGENVIFCEVKSGKERRTKYNSFSLL